MGSKGQKLSEEQRRNISKAMKKQYADGTRDRKKITQSANEALRQRTRLRNLNGNPTKKIDKDGYVIIYTEKGWRKEHHVVWEKHNCRIPRGYVIHHINGDKQDNRIGNLKMMTQNIHMKGHKIPRDGSGRFVREDES